MLERAQFILYEPISCLRGPIPCFSGPISGLRGPILGLAGPIQGRKDGPSYKKVGENRLVFIFEGSFPPGSPSRHTYITAVARVLNFWLRLWCRLSEVLIRGSATPMKIGGDGDQAAAKQGFSSEGNPYQKPKTQRILPTIFLKMVGIITRTLENGGDASPRPPVAEPLVLIISTQNEDSTNARFFLV